MPLADDIRTVRDRALTDLIATHDYYSETTIAWELVDQIINAGRVFQIRSATTGTATTSAELAIKARGYVKKQLAEATFQEFLATFESFYADLVHLWLVAHPQSLGRKMVDFRTILDAPDKEAITRHVVGKELNDVLYGRPAAWFAYLEDKANLGCPTAKEVERIAEVKASRDVLVHNRGIVNATYASKAGNRARFAEGERIAVPEPYHRATWELFRKVVADLSDAAIAKAS